MNLNAGHPYQEFQEIGAKAKGLREIFQSPCMLLLEEKRSHWAGFLFIPTTSLALRRLAWVVWLSRASSGSSQEPALSLTNMCFPATCCPVGGLHVIWQKSLRFCTHNYSVDWPVANCWKGNSHPSQRRVLGKAICRQNTPVRTWWSQVSWYLQTPQRLKGRATRVQV